MPLVFAAIAPHGFPLIPDLDDDAGGAMTTRAAMEELGRRAATADVEALVIAGPHGVRVDGAVSLADTARAVGRLAWQGKAVELNVPVDGPLTDAIAATTRSRGIPIAMVGYAGHRRDTSVLPLDWGILTPLWFLGHGRNMPGHGDVLADPPAVDIGPPAVIVAPSRGVSRNARRLRTGGGRSCGERTAPYRIHRLLRLGARAPGGRSVRLPSRIGRGRCRSRRRRGRE